MRIDGTYRPEPLGVQDASAEKGKAERPIGSAASDKSAGVQMDPATVSGCEALARTAGAAEEVDSQAVTQALRAIEDGSLDTLDAARRAAQAILDLGL